MQTPGEDFFKSALRLAKSITKPTYSERGIKLTWDLDNLELRGEFVIPIKTTIDTQTGQYIVTSENFADDPPTEPTASP